MTCLLPWSLCLLLTLLFPSWWESPLLYACHWIFFWKNRCSSKCLILLWHRQYLGVIHFFGHWKRLYLRQLNNSIIHCSSNFAFFSHHIEIEVGSFGSIWHTRGAGNCDLRRFLSRTSFPLYQNFVPNLQPYFNYLRGGNSSLGSPPHAQEYPLPMRILPKIFHKWDSLDFQHMVILV